MTLLGNASNKLLGERVRQRRKDLGISAEALAVKMRKQSGTTTTQAEISSLENGRTKTFREMVALAKALEISSNELLGDNIPQPEIKYCGKDPKRISQDPHTVPILGHSSILSDGNAAQISEHIGTAPRHPKQEGIRHAFATYVSGDSMEPRFHQGELVYCVSNIPPKTGQDCLVELKNGQTYTKEFVSWSNGNIICRQHKPSETWTRSAKIVAAVHVIVGR
ncbi:MAG: LexA family transcriptional regulator [Alphaproteobacteria bacterium]|nr:LexA family transcriptional regulator [Alphaproteobacteria bacterium]